MSEENVSSVRHDLELTRRRLIELGGTVRELTALVSKLNGVVSNLESRLTWLEGKVERQEENQ